MDDDNLKADVVIIGSGVSGALIANELVSTNASIIILESGPRKSREDIVKDYRSNYIGADLAAAYPNTPLSPRPDISNVKDNYHLQDGPTPFLSNYLRIVGGTTWHWGAVTMRLMEHDFNMRKRFSFGADWPLTYQDLEPYYVRAEKAMGVSGPNKDDLNLPKSKKLPLPPQSSTYLDRFVQGKAAEIGMKFSQLSVARNSREYDDRSTCVGFGSCSPICPSGAQYAAIHHIEQLQGKGVELLDNALVTRIDHDESNRIKSVQIKRPDGKRQQVRGKIFVLAANAIESPRLLLASASDNNPRGLANNSGHVGRNLMSHPGFNAVMTIKDPVYPGRGPRNGFAYLTQRKGSSIKQRAAYYMQIVNEVNVPQNALALINKGLLGQDLDEALRNKVSRELKIFAKTEQLPSFENRLFLDHVQKDSAGMPKVRFKYHIDDYTHGGIEEAKSKLSELAKHLGTTKIDYFSEKFTPHPMGTARMSKDALQGVVDHNGQSFDHDNLYLAGAALFPTGGTATPTLTIAALAIKTADQIKTKLT